MPQNKKMTEFPVLKDRSFMMGKLASFRVHCICRMPLASDDIFESKDCSLCNEAYHDSCVSLQGVNIKNIPGKQRWICPRCAEECRLANNYIITFKNALSSTLKENLCFIMETHDGFKNMQKLSKTTPFCGLNLTAC